MRRVSRDHRLIDALESRTSVAETRTVWRVCREDRDPTTCGRARGRWDDGSFDVLYTAAERNGAIAEMHFHLRRGQPVFPSKIRYVLHELAVRFDRLLDLSDRDDLASLGVDMARFGRLSYGAHPDEYPRTQDIAEVAHFLEFDGLLVPNARWDCSNAVVFGGRVSAVAITIQATHGLVDWTDWQARHAPRPHR